MRHHKMDCDYCPPPHNFSPPAQRDWEGHPSWVAGMDALNAYGDWVSSVVLPIAFQWIDEHRPEVYANIPEELRDDVGTVIAAAFKLVKDLPAYERGKTKSTAYEAAVAEGRTDRINPAWTSVIKKVRTSTEAAFAEQPSLQVDLPE